LYFSFVKARGKQKKKLGHKNKRGTTGEVETKKKREKKNKKE
jgi:hypothetical protein